MDINYLYQQIEIAKKQAAISFSKAGNKKDSDKEAYQVYTVRGHALKSYAKTLYDKINKHKQKQAKKGR